MAKKTLNEAAVRRFQMLANLAPINEMYGHNMQEEAEEEAEVEMDAAEADAMDTELAVDDAEEDEAMEDEMAADDGTVDVTEQSVMDAMDALAKISDFFGQLSDAVGGEDMEAEMDAEDAAEDAEEEVADDAMGAEEDEMADEPDLMETLADVNLAESEEIVNEVAKRVAKRLKEAKQNSQS